MFSLCHHCLALCALRWALLITYETLHSPLLSLSLTRSMVARASSMEQWPACEDWMLRLAVSSQTDITPWQSAVRQKSHHSSQQSERHHTMAVSNHTQSDRHHTQSDRHHTMAISSQTSHHGSQQSDKHHTMAVRHHTMAVSSQTLHDGSQQSDRHHTMAVSNHTDIKNHDN